MEENKIDFLNPLTIMLFIAAFFSDVAFIGMIGLAIPAVGLAIALAILLLHYFCGIIILGFFWGKTSGWMPKVILLLSWILPLPILTVGAFIAILTSNKLIEFLVETVVIQAVAIGTAGIGEAAEVVAVTAEGAEVAATVAESAEVASETVEAGETIAEGTTEAGKATTDAVDEMASNEEGNPMENLQQELEEPEETEDGKAKKRVRKVFDIADRSNNADQDEEDEEEAA